MDFETPDKQKCHTRVTTVDGIHGAQTRDLFNTILYAICISRHVPEPAGGGERGCVRHARYTGCPIEIVRLGFRLLCRGDDLGKRSSVYHESEIE